MLESVRNIAKHIRKPNKKALAGTVILYLWALVSTNIAFHGAITLTIFCSRVLYAMIVFALLTFVFDWLLPNLDSPLVKNAVKMFLIYAVINLVIFRLIYPGAWKWDDINVFNGLMSSGHLNYWQHYLTILFYILCLCLFPFPAGIVMVQFTIISGIFGYCYYVLSEYPKGGKWKYLLLVTFFLIPTFDFNMWPLRLSLYCILEVMLVVMIIEPNLKGQDIWDCPVRCILIAMLTAVLANWRSEAILYAIMVPACLFLLYNKPWHWKKAGLLLISCVFLTGVVSLPQKHGMGESKNYDLTGILMPITPLCGEAVDNQDTEFIESIDKVLNVNLIADAYINGSNGIGLYWGDRANLIRPDFSEAEYSDMLESYVKLILKYPGVYLNERVHCFLETWKNPGTGSIGWLYTTDSPGPQYFATHYYVNRPISNSLRVKVGEILNAEGEKKATLWTFNYYAQTIAIFLFTIYLLARRSKWAWLALMMEVRMVLTFLTAPAYIFMYYYNVWLFGNFIIFAFAAFLCFKLQKRFGGKLAGKRGLKNA